jgi:pimeloyl-ACP methyl ester carboxylesterase
MSRSDVSFSSGGEECAAWLYRPEHAEAGEPTPLVVMAHGFSATRDLRLDAYAERFCDAGLGALLFDYRHFGDSGGEPRQLLDVSRQHADYHAAIAYARGLDWVDPDGVAVFGSSFSGGHAIAIGAQDPRIAAVVSQCPFTDALASLPKLGPVNMLKGTAAGMRDLAGTLAGRAPYYIPAIGPPGSFAVMTTPDAEPGMRALVPPGSPWQNRVAARIAVRVSTYRPGRAAAKLTCPALFCICEQDSVAPATRALAYAAKAPRGEVKTYPIGHFEIYLGEWFERAVGDQTEFLLRHLAVTRAPAIAAAR